MNWKEDRVIRAISGGATTIRDVSRKCFPGVRPVEKADSQVRNNVRRLVRDGLVRRAKRKAEAVRAYGAYEVTGKGAAYVSEAPAVKAPKPKVVGKAKVAKIVKALESKDAGERLAAATIIMDSVYGAAGEVEVAQ